MKKVYVLWYRYHMYNEDTDTIEGIFSSIDGAKNKLQQYHDEYPELAAHMEIEEHILED